MYLTLEIHYNANKKIKKYYLSSNYNNPVLKPCRISLDIINHYENTVQNIGE